MPAHAIDPEKRSRRVIDAVTRVYGRATALSVDDAGQVASRTSRIVAATSGDSAML